MATTADGSNPWTWSPAHQDYYLIVYRSDGSHDYKWSRSVQPTQATSSTTPATERPHHDLNNSGRNHHQPNHYAAPPTTVHSATPRTAEKFPVQNLPHLAPYAGAPDPIPSIETSSHHPSDNDYILHSPNGLASPISNNYAPQNPVVIKYPTGSYFNYYPPEPPHLLRCRLHRQPGYDHLSCYPYYLCRTPNNPTFVEKCNLVLFYGLFNPPTTTMTHCDYPYCTDPYCVERQIGTRGFRDDLKHHEDDDKNGNMKDGDNVGEHQKCRRTNGSSSDSDSSNARRRH